MYQVIESIKIKDDLCLNFVQDKFFKGFVDNENRHYTPEQVAQVLNIAIKKGLVTEEYVHNKMNGIKGSLIDKTCHISYVVDIMEILNDHETFPSDTEVVKKVLDLQHDVKKMRLRGKILTLLCCLSITIGVVLLLVQFVL